MIYYLFSLPILFLIIDTYKNNNYTINRKLQELDESNYDENW
jgi:hypothetical protein